MLKTVQKEQEFGTNKYQTVQKDISEGDVVTIEFDNMYDSRYSSLNTKTGEVVWVDYDPEANGTVTLKIKTEDGDEYTMNAAGEVTVQRDTEDVHPSANSIGRIQGVRPVS